LGEKHPQVQIQKDQNQAQHAGQKYAQETAQDVKKVSKVKKTGNDTKEINTAETATTDEEKNNT
jgi:hypothetical protein